MIFARPGGPLLPHGGGRHELTVRLVAVCAIALAFTLAAGALLSGLLALQSLLDRTGPPRQSRPPAPIWVPQARSIPCVTSASKPSKSSLPN